MKYVIKADIRNMLLEAIKASESLCSITEFDKQKLKNGIVVGIKNGEHKGLCFRSDGQYNYYLNIPFNKLTKPRV